MELVILKELAEQKLKEFAQVSFDEINKRFSPSELLQNSEKNGISGDFSEQKDLEKSTTDTLKVKLETRLPEANETTINKIKGNISEELMDEYFKKSGWEKIEGEVGVNGIDGLYAKRDENRSVKDTLMVESKYNTSQLGDTKDGKQMSKDWILKKLDNLEKAYPDNQDYSQIKELVKDDKYRARLWQMNEVDSKLYISLKKIDSLGDQVSISKLSGNENYKVNKIPEIDLNNPSDSYHKSISDIYNKIIDSNINKIKNT